MAPTRSKAPAATKKRGRPPGSRNSGTVTTSAATPTATKKTAPRKRPTREEAEDELAIAETDYPKTWRTRKSKSQVQANGESEAQPKSRKKYVQLAARTKKIPQEQIDAWPQVPTQVLEQITAVIRDAMKDIANAQRDDRRVIAAHNTLNPLVKKLERQLADSRIPPQAKDIHFNIDKLTERNTQLAREVTTARHSKQLLAEQVKIAQGLLKKEEDNLEDLKRDAKKWRSEWKHQKQRGRLHPLMQDRGGVDIGGDGPDDIGLQQSKPVDASLFETADAELDPILAQLRRSLENLQGNHAQVEGIDEAMRAAQVALDDVLFRHAGTPQYAAL